MTKASTEDLELLVEEMEIEAEASTKQVEGLKHRIRVLENERDRVRSAKDELSRKFMVSAVFCTVSGCVEGKGGA